MLSAATRRPRLRPSSRPIRDSLFRRAFALFRLVHTPGFAIALSLTLTSLVLVALLHVWTRLEIVRIGYALSEQTRLHQALREHEQRLRLELATRKDPAAIERVARERLHMAPPDPAAIRIVPRVPAHSGDREGARR